MKKSVSICKSEREIGWIKLVAIGKSDDGTSGVHYVLSFNDVDGETKILVMSGSKLVNKREVKKILIENGYPVVFDSQGWNYVFEQLIEQTDVRTVIRKTPGFCANGYLLADNTFIHKNISSRERPYLANDDDVILPIVDKKGSITEWKDNVAVYGKNSSRLMLSILATISSYLSRLLGIESGGFHLFSDSSTGKSTCHYCSESVRGPRNGKGSWNMSEAGLINYLSGHNDSIVNLNEIGTLHEDKVQASKIAGKRTYLIAEGERKILSTRYMHAKQQEGLDWVVTVLSSGEESLAKHSDNGNRKRFRGEEVRLIDVPADAGKNMGIFETIPLGIGNSKELAEIIDNNTKLYYGTAQEKFLKIITKLLYEDKEKLCSTLSGYMNDFFKANKVNENYGYKVRFAKRFALCYAAGILAVRFKILPYSRKQVMMAVTKCYLSALENLPVSIDEKINEAYEKVKEIVLRGVCLDIRKSGHGYSEKELKSATCYFTSIKGQDYKAIPANSMKRIIKNDEVLKMVFDKIKSKGLLLCSKGKFTRSPASRISGTNYKLPRCYCFKFKPKRDKKSS